MKSKKAPSVLITKYVEKLLQRLTIKTIALLLIVCIIPFLLTNCKSIKTSVNHRETLKTQTSQRLNKSESLVEDKTREKVVLNIAAVMSSDILIMRKLGEEFTEKTGIKLKFNIFNDNELRKKVIEDVRVGGGKYDVVTVGSYDVPLWGKYKLVECLEPFFYRMPEKEKELFDRGDFIPTVTSALSDNNMQYALPYYAESSMLYYRKDLFERAGLKMPENPSWEQVYNFAKRLHNPSEGVYGIILRGYPGWNQNISVLSSIINTFGARWFDKDWNPQFETYEMRNSWEFYKKIVTETAQPEPANYRYEECLGLFLQGKASMWYDTTGAVIELNKNNSKIAKEISCVRAPSFKKNNAGWLWVWSLAIESSSRHKDEAFRFITWATSKEYINRVANKFGYECVPQGTRISTYNDSKYKEAVPFTTAVFEAIKNAKYEDPTVKPAPYVGIQYVSIPEFRKLGDTVAQQLTLYVTGKKSIDEALKASQEAACETVKENDLKNSN